MNTNQLLSTALTTALIAAAAFSATVAMAGTGETDGYTAAPFSSTRSRTGVQAELTAALRSPGSLMVGQASPVAAVALANTPFASVRSRAEVKAEVLAARADGTLATAGEVQQPAHPQNRVPSHRNLASLQR